MVKHYPPPPPGVRPNYANPTTQSSWSLPLYICLLVLTTVAVLLRLYTRLCISRFPWGTDDFFCALSYLFCVGYTGLLLKVPSVGFGRHIWEVPTSTLSQAAVYLGVADFLHLAAITSLKLTFLSYYYHYFWLHAPCRRMVIVGIVFVCVAAVAFFTTAAVTAVPSLSPAYNRHGEKGLPEAVAYAYAAFNTLTNIFILIVPIPCLRRLQLAPRERIKVAALFFLGSCACGASIGFVVTVRTLRPSPDITWVAGIMCMLGAVETHLGILCACLLLLPAFLEGNGSKRMISSLAGCCRARNERSNSTPPLPPFTSEITSITELRPTHQRESSDNHECG